MSARDDFVSSIETLLGQALDDAEVKTLWFDARPGYGLRLSELGWQIAVDKLRMEHWDFDIDASVLVPKNLLILDRQLNCPYYLYRRGRTMKLILFGSQEAVMANLYGDVSAWLISLVP